MHPMWIADIQDKCIFGLDFLELHGCMVDLADNVLHINGEEVPLQKKAAAWPKQKHIVLSWTVLSAFPLIRSVLHWPRYQGRSQVKRSGEYWNPTGVRPLQHYGVCL